MSRNPAVSLVSLERLKYHGISTDDTMVTFSIMLGSRQRDPVVLSLNKALGVPCFQAKVKEHHQG